MTSRVEQLVVLVSASQVADAVRRDLIDRGIALVTATASLARLRRSLVTGSVPTPVVFCITLDEPTLRRHGKKVTRMLEDRSSFAGPLSAIGLRVNRQAPAGWASLGCDACASDTDEFERLLNRFAAAHARADARHRRAATRESAATARLERGLSERSSSHGSRKTLLRPARTRAKWI